MRPNDWCEYTTANAATATATRAAETNGGRHIVNYVVVSFETSTDKGLLTVKKGTTTQFVHMVHGADVVPIEMRGNPNEAVSAELASGGAGEDGYVSIHGFTE
jgi:hypothetical protein